MLVRVRQIRAGHATTDAHPVGERRACSQAGFDPAQALAIRQLTEDHRGKMIVGAQRSRRPGHRKSGRRTRQLVGIQSGKNLSEDRRREVHLRARMVRISDFETKSKTSQSVRYSSAERCLQNQIKPLAGQP